MTFHIRLFVGRRAPVAVGSRAAGRLVTSPLHDRHPISCINTAVFALQAAGIAALPLIGASFAGAVIAVTVFGLGFGVATIARPALLADRYGTTNYAPSPAR